MKRCGNCGKYPFCDKIKTPRDVCNEWLSMSCMFCLGCNRLEIEAPEIKECKC